MGTIIRRNERSWAIDLITKINEIAGNNDIVIKRAGGENTISINKGNNMFPDVILFGDRNQTEILQGWELKMPDVPIEDNTFIKDAWRKADALHLNSCIIWNFTYAVLYVRNDNGIFEKNKQWDDTNFIKTRSDVERYRLEWEELLEKILFEINDFYLSGKVRKALLGEVISSITISTLILRNKERVSEFLKDNANKDSEIEAYIDAWWCDVKKEYEHDEKDMYSAYAKIVILNWSNRITFAHIIKNKRNPARIIDDLDYDKSPKDANEILKNITKKCDFYNVFAPIAYNELVPDDTWKDLMEYSVFLKENGIETLEQSVLQSILEGSVNQIKRELNGQYTTPYELARLLVRLTVKDWSDNILDCCCGTGTIPKAALEIKKKKFDSKKAIETVWASDKYQYPLQVANISMASPDAMKLANRLFQHNALTLEVSEEIILTNPENGEEMQLSVPKMGAITSNLPFVEFEKLPPDDLNIISKMAAEYGLDARSDLYFYIALKISNLLKPGGRLGIITSNSWLGTTAGTKFISAVKKEYDLLQVHISGKGRWFNNADVVTTIVILKKKDSTPSDKIQFYLWKKSLGEIEASSEIENKIVNSALLGKEQDADVVKLSEYKNIDIEELLSFNCSYNAFFHGITWLKKFACYTIPIHNAFHVFRGSRRGWDALFYPRKGEHHIEQEYLQRVLINARFVDSLVTLPDRDAFCCDVEIETLKKRNHLGALEWINRFVDQKNKVGKPLSEVLKRKGMQWYELQVTEIAELFTMMNPDERLFFAKFKDGPAFVNQRLIGLTHKKGYEDIELNHALLNSVFTMFSIEASGFGRGLGVLDINKDSLARCRMFSPLLLSKEDWDRIVTAFEPIKRRNILRVSEELTSQDRLDFEKAVFSAYGLEEELERVIASLKSMQQTRATVRKKTKL